MNAALARFLLDLVRDPARLSAFNRDPDREAILSQAREAGQLSADDERALLSGDASDVLRQLAVGADEAEQLMFTIGPGIKPKADGGSEYSYLVGFGIKGPPPRGTDTRTARKSTTARSKKSGTVRKGRKAPARKPKGRKR